MIRGHLPVAMLLQRTKGMLAVQGPAVGVSLGTRPVCWAAPLTTCGTGGQQGMRLPVHCAAKRVPAGGVGAAGARRQPQSSRSGGSDLIDATQSLEASLEQFLSDEAAMEDFRRLLSREMKNAGSRSSNDSRQVPPNKAQGSGRPKDLGSNAARSGRKATTRVQERDREVDIKGSTNPGRQQSGAEASPSGSARRSGGQGKQARAPASPPPGGSKRQGRGYGADAQRGEGGGRGQGGSSKAAPGSAYDTAIGRAAVAAGAEVPTVILKVGRERLFVNGSPMVYNGAVEQVVAPRGELPIAGDVVVVADSDGVPLGWGVYNSASMFRVRMMQTELEAQADASCVLDMAALLDMRVSRAAALRHALGLPSEDTDVYRLINSEGDRLSGVIADVLGHCVVVQSCAAWSERYKEAIIGAIKRHAPGTITDVIWRANPFMLEEEGIPSSAGGSSLEREAVASSASGLGGAPAASGAQAEGGEALSEPNTTGGISGADDGSTADEDAPKEEGGSVGAAPEAPLTMVLAWEQPRVDLVTQPMVDLVTQPMVHLVREGGLCFGAAPYGQKTGFYADQRDTRTFVSQLVRDGMRVLDLCCYSGPFAVRAAAAGASSVTGVDTSAAAVELASANAERNGLSATCTFVRADISKFLKAAITQGDVWDIVILDPPKLAPNRATLQRATAKYRKLNSLALQVVQPGGFFTTCSCSGAMTQSGGLLGVVQEAATEAGRQVTLLRRAGAAPDHPLHPSYPEGQYLTALTFVVQ